MLPSANTALGAIVYGVAATAIVAATVFAARLLSAPAFRLFVWVGRKIPERYRPALREGADKIAPTWRKVGGVSRPGFESRLSHLRAISKPVFALIGGIYYDVSLNPVNLNNLVVGEYSDLNSIRIDVGGSAAWVGRFLYGRMNGLKKSYLFSRLGNDSLSKELRRMLSREPWIRKFYQVPATHAQCGTSFNLEPLGYQLHTTLTHRGSLTSFDWHQFLPKLHRKVKRGGIIYISGYFRSNLCQDLATSLEALPAKTVVCVDHGRFQKEDFERAGAALAQAFADGLIDVYLCSHVEFTAFARANLGGDLPLGTEEMLKLCYEACILPPVTVIHGEPEVSGAVAYLAYQGQVRFTKVGEMSPGARLGSQNAFNAGFLYKLACGSEDANVDQALDEAVVHALEMWTKTMSTPSPS